MRLFKIERRGQTGWDQYDSFVVRASDEESARRLPGPEMGYGKDPPYPYIDLGTWTNPALSTCEELSENGEEEIICASFNAG